MPEYKNEPNIVGKVSILVEEFVEALDEDEYKPYGVLVAIVSEEDRSTFNACEQETFSLNAESYIGDGIFYLSDKTQVHILFANLPKGEAVVGQLQKLDPNAVNLPRTR